ncbi:MAG: metallophosphoesterase [Opitutaceae bacterium]|nr:metallophosphoesterase [Opitutaceae bacterium]
MRIFRCTVALALLIFLTGCVTAGTGFKSDVSSEAHPWTHLRFRNSADNLRFAILADRNGGCRPGIFEDAVRKLNRLQPDFVMCVGDLIVGAPDDPASLAKDWDEVESMVQTLEMPFFHVAGNHDIGNTHTLAAFRERFGSPYYHFVYRDVLFLCLDTEDPPEGHIGSEQTDYFRKVLQAHPQVRWTLVFMHEPLWEMKGETGFGAIEALLQDRPYTVFAGHWHSYAKTVRNGRDYYRLATTGGASGLKPEAGQFDEIAWVTMTEKGPVLTNLMLNGILDDTLGKPKD